MLGQAWGVCPWQHAGYMLEHKLGSGSFSTVWAGRSLAGDEAAVKASVRAAGGCKQAPMQYCWLRKRCMTWLCCAAAGAGQIAGGEPQGCDSLRDQSAAPARSLTATAPWVGGATIFSLPA